MKSKPNCQNTIQSYELWHHQIRLTDVSMTSGSGIQQMFWQWHNFGLYFGNHHSSLMVWRQFYHNKANRTLETDNTILQMLSGSREESEKRMYLYHVSFSHDNFCSTYIYDLQLLTSYKQSYNGRQLHHKQLKQHSITIKWKNELTLSARCNGQNILTHGGGFFLVWHELNGGSILLSYSLANASLHEHHVAEKC